MKILKLKDDAGNTFELHQEMIAIGEVDVISVAFSICWDGNESFYNITDVDELDEVLSWLGEIREQMDDN